jgi:hypothetical protein
MRFFVSIKHGSLYGTLGSEADALRKLVITRVAVIKMLSQIPCTQSCESILVPMVRVYKLYSYAASSNSKKSYLVLIIIIKIFPLAYVFAEK